MVRETYQKHLVNLRGWYDGRGYHMALESLEYARVLHDGVRKDGVTPEFAHQVFIALFLRNFDAYLIDPDRTFTAVHLHDVVEDKPRTLQDIERRFDARVAHSVGLLTAPDAESEAAKDFRFLAMAQDAQASVVKAGDRVHNLLSMVGVFRPEKQVSYLGETDTLILPMIKTARRVHTRQIPIYEIAKLLIRAHSQSVRALLLAEGHGHLLEALEKQVDDSRTRPEEEE